MNELRGYQNTIINEMKAAINNGSRSILLVAPTGSGKTTMVAHVIKDFGLNALAVAHRVEICSQIRNEFNKRGLYGSYVKGVMAQRTLTLASDDKQVDTVFIDEAHHIASPRYQKLVGCSKNKILIGATATPYRLDGASIVGNFESVIYAPTHDELVGLGYLAKPEFISALDINFDDIKSSVKGDYDEKGSLDRIRIVVHAGDLPRILKQHTSISGSLIYAVNIEHCELIRVELDSVGISCKVLTSHTPRKERESILKEFEKDEIDCIVNCEVLTEGTDIRGVRNVVMIRPTKSLVLYKQMIGRGSRPDCECKIVDLVGNIPRFGDVFSKHSWKRDKRTKQGATSSCPPMVDSAATLLHLESVETELKSVVIPKGVSKFLGVPK